MQDKTPILIYQMGKTAGNSLRFTLYLLGHQVEYVHFLSSEQIQNWKNSYDRRGIKPTQHWQDSVRIQQVIQDAWPDNLCLNIITTFREPVGRLISAVFEDIDNLYPQLRGRADDEAVETVSGHIRRMLERFNPANDFTANWFDREIGRVLGVDVYAFPFNHERGYSIRDIARSRLLILKYESLSKCYAAAFRDFLGLPDFELVNCNVSGQKHYSELYKRVRGEFRLESHILDPVYATRYVRHFYTAHEIESFKRRWSGVLDPVERLVRLAEKHLASGARQDLVETCREITSVDPNNVRACHLLGRMFREMGEDRLAIRQYQKAIQIDPFNRETVIQSSLLMSRYGMADSACRLCEYYIRRNPEDMQVRHLLEQMRERTMAAVE